MFLFSFSALFSFQVPEVTVESSTFWVKYVVNILSTFIKYVSSHLNKLLMVV